MSEAVSAGTGAPLRCVLIGGESLLIQCAEILLQQGHRVTAVVSSEPAIRDWAASHGIRTVPFDASLAAALASEPFDFLFSIANLRVIPADVLALPLRGAINFHDGPLPRYAGLHATSWALLHGERRHGITWHAIAGGIDDGDILAQEPIEIDDDERALTLNAKCYEAGIRTFDTLVRQLANGSVRPQRQALEQRTYFGAFKRPAALGSIDWRRPAAEIDALVRALDFGGYANPLALPKASVNGRPFLVTELVTLDERSGEEPGTIVGVDDQGIRVATGTSDVRLTRVARDDGYVKTAAEFVVKVGLTKGARLDTLTDDVVERLTSIHERVARHEQFWVTRLATRTPLDLPYAPVEALSRRANTLRRSDLTFTPALAALTSPATDTLAAPAATATAGVASTATSAAADRFAAVTLAWLSRLTDAQMFDVDFADVALRQLTEGVDRWFADSVPLRVEVTRDLPLAAQLDALTASISEVRRRQTFTRDLAGRQPSLKALLTPAVRRTRWAVRIELVDTLDPAGTAAGAAAITATAAAAATMMPATGPSAAALTIRIADDGRSAWLHDPEVIAEDVIRRMQAQLLAFAADGLKRPEVPVGQLTILPEDERAQILVEWNQTAVDYDTTSCIDEVIAAQAARAPERVALVSRAASINYADLDARAAALASHLRTLGVGPGVIVGLAAARSIELMVGLLGILKAGGAYLPLDPDYPADRLAFMIEDSRAPIVVTQRAFAAIVPPNVTAVLLDDDSSPPHPNPLPASGARESRGSSDLAYVIYTSGSTGKPKGVMVTHRNVMNFAAAMDERLDHDRDGTWLAVTSLSFDISVLELLWTLARGFTVVVHGGASRAAHRAPGAAPSAAHRSSVAVTQRRRAQAGQLQFSLFYFSSDEGEVPGDRYHLLLEGAAFADREDFTAVWTPERHFHSFGGLYPNPSVISAAIAATTTGVDIRAGSVVLPLHHPARVVEEWSVVDNLSRGRVGISFASGWQPNDFILRPENFRDAKAVMMRDIDVVRRLWRGEKVKFAGPKGDDVEISTLPRPIQSDLPVWITTAGNPETFRMAGEAGAYVLTHLLGQSVKELGAKLDVYREAWKAAGHAGAPHVTLMLHTFIGDDVERVRETVRGPMKKYLASSVSLIKDHASSFPAFRNVAGGSGGGAQNIDSLFATMSPEDLDALLDYSFSRYFETGGLFGTPDSVAPMIDSLNAIGVDEIACLIDFGVPSDQVLAGLKPLKDVRDRYAGSKTDRKTDIKTIAEAEADDDYSIAGELTRHRVTHLQCTPSLAAMLVADPASRAALSGLRRMLVGGEALSPVLAQQLREAAPASTLINMYGPTETTVWSTSHTIDGASSTVPIGRPIANTQCYILDRAAQPVPIGVAGELFIGGDGVTRGYLHRPELTAERFVVSPFADVASADAPRLYRTGDLTRYRPDGIIEFLGRLDHQVKIRGHRIELGEIETALRAVDGLREAVVVLREDTPGDARLIGYVSIADGRTGTLDIEAVRRGLSSVLPDIMVPSRLVVLDRLPLTPNGKIDRRALPAPEPIAEGSARDGAGARRAATPSLSSPLPASSQQRADAHGQMRPGADIAASGDIESVSGIWRDVLRLPSVGLDDNFFDLGGHSLLAVQVLALVRERLGRTIPITDLFRFPTVRLMARHLEGGSSSPGSAALDRGRARADARRQARQRRPV
jgi:natural product biosynthesis luciferase-like monooxygenase protein